MDCDQEDTISHLLASLPTLNKADVDVDESCPICLVPFGERDEDGGVTRLVGCGHVFCRKDLTEWIRSHHGTCPTCRNTFLDILPVSESDDESSDGGEYVPNSDGFEDEDEDAFADSSEDDFDVDYMELDVDEFWEEEPDVNDGQHEQEVVVSYLAPAGEEWNLTDSDESDPTSSSSSETNSTIEETRIVLVDSDDLDANFDDEAK